MSVQTGVPPRKVSHLKVQYACYTQAGIIRGNAKENQDVGIVRGLAESEHMLFGVFDGHGPQGGVISNVVATTLLGLIEKTINKQSVQENSQGLPDDRLVSCFHECSRTLDKIVGIDCGLSGSTGIVALLATHNLTVANVGDSRCVLGKLSQRGEDGHQKVSAYDLSNDHKPCILAEANRILAAGGRIAALSADGRCRSASAGPLRVWLKDKDMPGLAMTRSFGDRVAASVGVIDVPEVLSYDLQPHDRYVVLMSDGITDQMETWEVIEFVHACATQRKLGAREAARALVKEANRRWDSLERGRHADDCTAIVIYIEPGLAKDKPSLNRYINAEPIRSALSRGFQWATRA